MKKRICFVGLDNYPVLNPALGNAYIGGESIQQTLLSKAFSDMGYDISMIVKDHGQPDGEMIDNIQVWKTYKENSGIPVFRFIHPRMTSVFQALRKADADIYYQSCAGVLTGQVAVFCRSKHRKFIFRIASDSDCVPGQQLIRYWRDRKIYEYGLRRADLIAAQGTKQMQLLQRHYALVSTPVNMVVELPKEQSLTADRDIDVLWVNNLRQLKRPELFFQLAIALPKYRFVMIGGPCPGLEGYYQEMLAKTRTIKNLEFLGAVPYGQVNKYFSRAKVFANTSEIEGFPNSFLQAWIRGVPVVSFFDPDGLISSHGLGGAPTGPKEMTLAVEMLLNDDPLWQRISLTVRTFALNNYAPEKVAERYLDLLEHV